jgi:hypothetical protein
MIVDATRPRDFAFGSRSEVPEDVIRRMPLDEYVAGPTLAAAK